MPRVLLTIAALLLLALPAAAEPFTATLYPQGKRDVVLFTQRQTEQKSGDTVTSVQRVYLDPAGKEAAVEDIVYEGGKLKSFRVDQKQVNEQGLIEIKGSTVHFAFTAEGKTKTDTENISPDFIISPMLVSHLHGNWGRLMTGEVVKARLGVADRLETVGFQFTKVGEAVHDGKPIVLVMMKPSSFIISALVKPIRLTFDTQSRRLIEYSGRAVPRQRVDGKWETLDADVVYKY